MVRSDSFGIKLPNPQDCQRTTSTGEGFLKSANIFRCWPSFDDLTLPNNRSAHNARFLLHLSLRKPKDGTRVRPLRLVSHRLIHLQTCQAKAVALQ